MNVHNGFPLWRLGEGSRATAVSGQVATMVDTDDHQLAERLWDAQLVSGADGALELLLRGGITTVPDFVLIEIEGATVRLVVRGKAVVVADGDDGPVTYEGTNVRLVAEHVIDTPALIHGGFVGSLPALVTPTVYGIASGFGLFDWVALGDDYHAYTTVGSVAMPVPHIADHPGVTDTDEIPDDAESERIFVNPPDVALAHHEGSPEVAVVVDDVPVDDQEVGADVGSADDAATGVPVDGSDATGGPAGDADADADVDAERYASIFGATMQRSVIDAAIRQADDDGVEASPLDDHAPDHGIAPKVIDTAVTGTTGDDRADLVAAPEKTQISVDTMPPGDHQLDDRTRPPIHEDDRNDDGGHDDDGNDDLAVRPAGAGGLGDHDGHTISRADLPSLAAFGDRPSGPVDNPVASATDGPRVQSVRCSSGHDNPPSRSTCGRCQQPLDAEPVSIVRPPVGTLTFSTGDQVTLDRPVLVGRRPDIAGLTCSEIPREVAIDVGDGLSRSHALFSIAGWQVRVEDLGSTNHTTIRLPGQTAQRLRVGEPAPITDGTVIDLGGEVTCRYDVTF